MKSLLLDEGGQAIGIIAEDGTRWIADRVVLCTGAWSDALVDMEGQLEAKCWTLAHIQLTPEECAEFKDIPVVMNLEEGEQQRRLLGRNSSADQLITSFRFLLRTKQ
jgi:glycine/D-amino acid oxidase-like deaminating enzyme